MGNVKHTYVYIENKSPLTWNPRYNSLAQTSRRHERSAPRIIIKPRLRILINRARNLHKTHPHGRSRMIWVPLTKSQPSVKDRW